MSRLRLSLKKHLVSGFTLVEVIFAVALLSIVLVTFVGFLAANARRSASTTLKILATHHTEDIAQWIRVKKDEDWERFYALVTGGSSSASSRVFCVNTSLDLDISVENGLNQVIADPSECPYGGIGSSPPLVFRRTVQFTFSNSTTLVDAVIVTAWQGIGGVEKSQYTTRYSPVSNY